MKKANGLNVIQNPMSEQEPYHLKRVTKVVYQHERFKRNAKKVKMFFYTEFFFSFAFHLAQNVHRVKMCFVFFFERFARRYGVEKIIFPPRFAN